MTQKKELAFETMKKDWEKKAFEANLLRCTPTQINTHLLLSFKKIK